ncbi:hypothetical protein ACIRU8_20360 [Streptomyces sp. NPDC101175]|uniref:hypothetical protein n=1 Tax=Streptomyces sp. NPDC101175 TaxID=3366123 RepID=UPI003835C8B8
MGPLFYTSYASSAGDRGPVQRFHFDVQSEVYGLLGHSARYRGRLQRAAPALRPDQAVLTCRSLLVLYSADYLADRRCALEWAVFHARMERRQWLTGDASDALIGVPWRTDALVLPRVVADTGELLEAVGEHGQGPDAAGLQGDPGAWQRYRALVRRVAERLTRAARTPLPALSEDDSASVKPYFGPESGEDLAGRAPPPPLPPWSDERHLVLVLLAGTRDVMERLREFTACYAESAGEWRPFWPHSDVPAADIAGFTARDQGVDRLTVITLDGNGGDFEESLEELSETARSAVVMVLVDPWLTGDAAFSVRWEQLARSGTRIAAVITVLPLQDRESRRAAGRLRETLARTPARRLGAVHHEAGSPPALAHAVAAVLADIRTEAEEDDTPSDRASEPLRRLAHRPYERTGGPRQRGSWPPPAVRTPRESWGGG